MTFLERDYSLETIIMYFSVQVQYNILALYTYDNLALDTIQRQENHINDK